MPNKKILGHGGHGLPTPNPSGGGINRKATTMPKGAPPGYRPGVRATRPAPRPVGGRVSALSYPGTGLNPTHIGNAIQRAKAGESAVAPAVLSFEGFSTPTMRRLVNNLMAVKKDIVYVEAGAYCGGTSCAAVSNRQNVTGYVYEDFSQPFDLEDVRGRLLANIARTDGNLTLIEGDFFKAELPPLIDVFFYDGEHSEANQARALPHVADRLADVSLMLVDDYNWPEVEKGTKAALKAVEGKLRVAARWILEGEKPNDDKIWHNGLALFLLTRV